MSQANVEIVRRLYPGSFDLVSAFTDPEGEILVSPRFRQFFMIGVCGGYTTFSSFSLQTLNLARDGQWLYVGMNIVLSVTLCLVSVWIGHVSALAMNHGGLRW